MSNIDEVDEEESKTIADRKRIRKDVDSEEEIEPWSTPEGASTAESVDEDGEPET